MTAQPSSPVGRLADVVLRLPSEETKYERVASFYSQVAMGYYLNVLYSYLFVLDY